MLFVFVECPSDWLCPLYWTKSLHICLNIFNSRCSPPLLKRCQPATRFAWISSISIFNSLYFDNIYKLKRRLQRHDCGFCKHPVEIFSEDFTMTNRLVSRWTFLSNRLLKHAHEIWPFDSLPSCFFYKRPLLQSDSPNTIICSFICR